MTITLTTSTLSLNTATSQEVMDDVNGAGQLKGGSGDNQPALSFGNLLEQQLNELEFTTTADGQAAQSLAANGADTTQPLDSTNSLPSADTLSNILAAQQLLQQANPSNPASLKDIADHTVRNSLASAGSSTVALPTTSVVTTSMQNNASTTSQTFAASAQDLAAGIALQAPADVPQQSFIQNFQAAIAKQMDAADMEANTAIPTVNNAPIDGITHTSQITSVGAHLGINQPQPVQANGVPAIHAPLHSPQFVQQAAERVQFVVNQGIQRAEIQINPAELGPIKVQIQIQQGETSVTLHAAHNETRQALEQALPRLRDALSTGGMTGLDVNVSQQQLGQFQQSTQQQTNNLSPFTNNNIASAIDTTEQVVTRKLNSQSANIGLLDTYA